MLSLHTVPVATVGSGTWLKFTLQVSTLFSQVCLTKKDRQEGRKKQTISSKVPKRTNFGLFVLFILVSPTNPVSLDYTDKLHAQQLQLIFETNQVHWCNLAAQKENKSLAIDEANITYIKI